MGIKKIKLNYKPIAERTCDEVAYVVSSDRVDSVNRSIANKVERNAYELRESYLDAMSYTVKASGPKLIRKK